VVSDAEGASDVDLREAVERTCRCPARPRGTVRVSERFGRYALWEGEVHVFELDGHPAASSCFAWPLPAGGAGRGGFRVVPAAPPIATAADAVRAAVLREG
jgi:hypothetical protein